jgi:hypothetical protein
MPAGWSLFSAGTFERDVDLTGQALQLPTPPRHVCAVAAGVREFGRVVENPDGVFGVAQWFPGRAQDVALGPSEAEFISAYADRADAVRDYPAVPDYPAVQAAAGATIAVHCARLAGATSRDRLWASAAGLQTSTLFGGFGIDPETGAQTMHQTVLVRWANGEPVPASPLP